MAIKFQYNKTFLQELNRQLRIRVQALPTLKNKESALRLEVKKARDAAHELEKQLALRRRQLAETAALWQEWEADLVEVEQVNWSVRKIAGVKTPELIQVQFRRKPFSLFGKPSWFAEGVLLLEELARLDLERAFLEQKAALLNRARKKTTQKVNLYEKVQIPELEEAIQKIKRFMEDEENLAKAAQKILKNRLQAG